MYFDVKQSGVLFDIKHTFTTTWSGEDFFCACAWEQIRDLAAHRPQTALSGSVRHYPCQDCHRENCAKMESTDSDQPPEPIQVRKKVFLNILITQTSVFIVWENPCSRCPSEKTKRRFTAKSRWRGNFSKYETAMW